MTTEVMTSRSTVEFDIGLSYCLAGTPHYAYEFRNTRLLLPPHHQAAISARAIDVVTTRDATDGRDATAERWTQAEKSAMGGW
jgi:hypothetical protein